MMRRARRWLQRRLRWLGLAAACGLPACSWWQETGRPADAAAQQACEVFVRSHPEVAREAAARLGISEAAALAGAAVDWYCSDPAILDTFRDEYLRQLRSRVRSMP